MLGSTMTKGWVTAMVGEGRQELRTNWEWCHIRESEITEASESSGENFVAQNLEKMPPGNNLENDENI